MAKVVIFSGAGISAESEIRTFRDSDGLWEEHKIEDICMAGCLDNNRKQTLNFYDARRVELNEKKSNYAHKKIAELKLKYPSDIAVITQNIDDLFEKANCNDVIHLHGFLTNAKCMNESCKFIKNIGYEILDKNETCPKCQNLLRPDVVFFNENAPMYKLLNKHLKDCKFLVVIGTSGTVINVNTMLYRTMKKRVLNNLESSRYIDESLFTKVLLKKSTQAIDEIAIDIEEFLEE